ncbi:MAG: hypothetical protein SWY16_20910 [Cyanobacteriota bacterium]|nr:hypothetical protein [Cyanobacteriota bacterium]
MSRVCFGQGAIASEIEGEIERSARSASMTYTQNSTPFPVFFSENVNSG